MMLMSNADSSTVRNQGNVNTGMHVRSCGVRRRTTAVSPTVYPLQKEPIAVPLISLVGGATGACACRLGTDQRLLMVPGGNGLNGPTAQEPAGQASALPLEAVTDLDRRTVESTALVIVSGTGHVTPRNVLDLRPTFGRSNAPDLIRNRSEGNITTGSHSLEEVLK